MRQPQQGLPRRESGLVAAAVLAEFGENPLGEFGMQKRDFLGVGAYLGLLVYEGDPLRFRMGEIRNDVVRIESNVVNAAVGIFFKEFGYWTVGRGGLEQFDMDSSDGEESCLDFLVRNFLDAFAFEAEDVFVIWNRIVNGFNGDAEMVDFLQHNNNLLF